MIFLNNTGYQLKKIRTAILSIPIYFKSNYKTGKDMIFNFFQSNVILNLKML